MKTKRIFKLMCVILLGVALTGQVEATTSSIRSDEKKAVVINVQKPVMDFVVKAFAPASANDIVRINKVLGQIEQVTISFRNEDATDYILKFEPRDNKELETWMFDNGYLNLGDDSYLDVPVPWMEDMDFTAPGIGDEEIALETSGELESEVPVPWMENIHFNTLNADASEVALDAPVPWLENLHFATVAETGNEDATEVPVPWMNDLHFD